MPYKAAPAPPTFQNRWHRVGRPVPSGRSRLVCYMSMCVPSSPSSPLLGLTGTTGNHAPAAPALSPARRLLRGAALAPGAVAPGESGAPASSPGTMRLGLVARLDGADEASVLLGDRAGAPLPLAAETTWRDDRGGAPVLLIGAAATALMPARVQQCNQQRCCQCAWGDAWVALRADWFPPSAPLLTRGERHRSASPCDWCVARTRFSATRLSDRAKLVRARRR